MPSIRGALIVALLLSPGELFAGGREDGERWSARIARSFLAMHPDSIVYPDEQKSRKWNYEQGLMLEALFQQWVHSGDSLYVRYVRRHLDYYVNNDGTIATYRKDDFNLDNIAPGKAVLRMYHMTGEEKYRQAARILRSQLQDQPRTPSKGFWHKKIYPNQMWLDGLYMAQPFYTMYALMESEPAVLDDVAHQFLLVRAHHRDQTTGLYYHGWDESRRQRWADPRTGRSANFWGRSIGWFMMALTDVLEYFPSDHPRYDDLAGMLRDLAPDVLRVRDTATALWYQVMDQPERGGNYREASASAMIAYALAKGVRLGLLPGDMKERAEETFRGILNHLVTIDESRRVHLNNVCKVAGLGGNPYRDGSFEYYVGEPKRTNDFKGYGPLLLAAIELERLSAGGQRREAQSR